ncbi:MAG: MFS transporter [Parcubacteria group bacterium]
MTRFVPVFVAGFFVSIHLGATLFVNSSLLGQFFEPDTISLLFLIGALGNIVLFLAIPRLIERFGKRLLLLVLLFITMFSTMVLALAATQFLVAVFFVIYASLIYMIFYCLDIFLEEISMDTRTGEIRGAFITFFHLGLILGLTALIFLTIGDTLKPVYLAASFLLVLPILLAIFSLKSPTPKWHGLRHHLALLPFKTWWRSKSVRRTTLARFSLEFFYAFMAIYTPLYLHGVLGFTWSIIGVIFIIMLLPFILFLWPVGKLADYFIGEKEFMIVGFLIMGTTLLLMPYLGASIGLWVIVLFFSRVGASLVEITSDSYFFKHASPDDTALLSIFRLTRPASVVLGAAVGAITLNLFSFDKIFFVLAVVVFFGLKESLSLKDTL